MKTDFEKAYHILENEHFWFKSRRQYIVSALKNADRNSKVLDIGCSSGILLKELFENGFKEENLYGIDISVNAIENCQNIGIINTFVMDAQEIDINEKFDIIISSDCLEHLKDDEKALKNWNNLLTDSGVAYIFVPAFMSLWSEHDEVNMHYRRYGRSELNKKLMNNGFVITKSGYWNFFLFMPIFIVRLLSRMGFSKSSKTGNLNKLPLFNNFFMVLLNFENRLLNYMKFPFGVSNFAIAKKDSANML